MSVFKNFLQLRNKFSDIAENNIDVMNMIAAGEITSDKICQTIKGWTVVTDTSNDLVKVMYDDNLINQFSVSDLSVGDTSKWNIEMVNSLGEKHTLDDLMLGATNATDAYSIMAQIAEKYSYTNRIGYSDIQNFLANKNTTSISVVKEALFSAMDEDGYVSMPAFLSIMDSWFKDGKEAVDDGSLELDTTNPYGLEAIFSIVVSAVSTAISVICIAIGGVFSFIGLLINGIINILMQLGQAFQSYGTIRFDPTVGNDFVEGPVQAMDSMISSSILHFIGPSPDHDRSIYYDEKWGLGTFIWYNGDFTGYRINSYLYPCFRPYQTIKYLVDNNIIQLNQTSSGYVLRFIGSNYVRPSLPDYCYFGYESSAPGNNFEAYASVLLGLFLYQLDSGLLKGITPEIGVGSITYAAEPPLLWARDEKATYYEALSFVRIAISDSSSYWNSLTIGVDKSSAAIVDWLSNDVLPYRDTPLGRASSVDTLFVLSTTGQGGGANEYLNWIMCYSFINMNDCFLWQPGRIYIAFNESHSGYEKADCLIQHKGIKLPNFNTQAVEDALLYTAILSTAAAFFVSRVKVALAKRKISRRFLKLGEVKAAQQAFEEDPTNDELRQNFENAVYKYNKWGSMFGWGTYDPLNGWVDYGTSDVNQNSLLGKILSSNSDDSNSILLKLQDILDLIR